MWQKFKWDMFVTSFIPLWMSIVIIDVWNVISIASKNWSNQKLFDNIRSILYVGKIELISIIIILAVMCISISGINSFMRRISNPKDKSSGKILKATKANKLSSEFLLAYILPMIAFDFSDLQNVVLFLLYFAVLAFLCIRNNNIYTNILLEFKGYKMYNCDIECMIANKTHIYYDSLMISKNDLTQEIDNDLFFWDFDNYIYMEIERE